MWTSRKFRLNSVSINNIVEIHKCVLRDLRCVWKTIFFCTLYNTFLYVFLYMPYNNIRKNFELIALFLYLSHSTKIKTVFSTKEIKTEVLSYWKNHRIVWVYVVWARFVNFRFCTLQKKHGTSKAMRRVSMFMCFSPAKNVQSLWFKTTSVGLIHWPFS